MVVFVCGKCNESLKKKNVEQHFNSCRTATVSCVDCSKDFTRQSFVSHTSCITEQEKYDKPNFAQKVPKGANKQMEWTEQVHSRLSSFPTQTGVINLMVKKLMDSSNIPKKKAKFDNFLKSCFKYSREADINQIWNFINGPPTGPAEGVGKVVDKDNASTPPNAPNVSENGDTNFVTENNSSSKRKDIPSSEVPPKKRQRKNTTEKENSQPADVSEVTCTSESSTEPQNQMSLREAIIAQILGKESMKITKLKKRAFKVFRNSTQFDKAIHKDDWLDRKFEKIMRSKKRFLITEDGTRVSLTPREERSKDEAEE